MISRRNVLTALPALCVGGAVLQARGAQAKPTRWQTWEYHGFDLTLHEFSSKLLSESPLKSLGEDGWSIAFQALVGTGSEQRVRIEMKRPLRVSPHAVWEFTQFNGDNSQVYSEMVANGWELCGQMRIENGSLFTAQRLKMIQSEPTEWEFSHDTWYEEETRTREFSAALGGKGQAGWSLASLQALFLTTPRNANDPYHFFFQRPVNPESRIPWAFNWLVFGAGYIPGNLIPGFFPQIMKILNTEGAKGWQIGAIIGGSGGSPGPGSGPNPGYRCLLQRPHHPHNR